MQITCFINGWKIDRIAGNVLPKTSIEEVKKVLITTFRGNITVATIEQVRDYAKGGLTRILR